MFLPMHSQIFELFGSDAPRSLMGDQWGYDEDDCVHPSGTEYCTDCLFVDPDIMQRY